MGALAEVEGAENLSTEKVDILGLTAEELEAKIRAEGLPASRARQIWRWVWRHGVTRSEEMTELARPGR